MATKIPVDPALITKSIEEKSKQVRAAAEWLASRIELFEDWIGKLPGRVDTSFWCKHPESNADGPFSDDYLELGLRLHRAGKQWTLSYSEFSSPNNDSIEWKPLKEAPIKVKIWAIKMFPDLLTSVVTSQDKLICDIDNATEEFNAFAEKVGIPPYTGETKKEGK